VYVIAEGLESEYAGSGVLLNIPLIIWLFEVVTYILFKDVDLK
jgi:hypothetical protein